MRWPFRIVVLLAVITSWNNEYWKVKEVDLGGGNSIYLKSCIWGPRGEHGRTIISRDSHQYYSENTDIDLGYGVPIHYLIEGENFVLLKPLTDCQRDESENSFKRSWLKIRCIPIFEYLDSNNVNIERFK